MAPSTHDEVLRSTLAELDPELILYDGLDGAIVGIAHRFNMEPVLVYDLERVRAILLADGGTFEEVQEHIDYNVLGLWAGDRTPVFIEPLVMLVERPGPPRAPCTAEIIGTAGCKNPRGCRTAGTCLDKQG